MDYIFDEKLYNIVKLRTGEKVFTFTGTRTEFHKLLSSDYVSFHRTSDFAFMRKEIGEDGFTSAKVYGSLFIMKKDFQRANKHPVDFFEVLEFNLGDLK